MNSRPSRAGALLSVLAAAVLLGGCAGPATGSETGAADVSSAPQQQETSPAESGDSAGSGMPVPANWPAEVLLPKGEIVLSSERGGGWDLLIEGIDESELTGLLDQMASAGFTKRGPTDMGSGAWVAELTGDAYVATYSYETGGAGLPNVRVLVMPA